MADAPFSPLAERSAKVLEPADLQAFLDTFLYGESAVLVDEITALDADAGRLEAILETEGRSFPFAEAQRTSTNHPGHVSGAELVMVTGALGCLHAWLFHGVRWDEGWAGFGNRIHRADFKSLARIGPPLHLESQETRSRVGPQRVVLRYDFHFKQGDDTVYVGDQTAMFFRDKSLE